MINPILLQWRTKYQVVVVNAGSLIGTQAITSALGFLYWWLAAHYFSTEAVGLASAVTQTMIFLGNMGMIGLGTLLIGELPRQPNHRISLVATSLLLSGIAGGGLGLLFVGAAPWIATDLGVLAESWQNGALFTFGVSLTSVSLVLDQGVIGLLRGELQLWRNTIFAVAKLVALLCACLWLTEKVGLTIYAAWAVGNLTSLAILAGFIGPTGRQIGAYRPQWGILRKLGRTALEHHALNLTLQATGLVLPLVVTANLSAEMNAYFYVAWMIASFGFVGPIALSMVLYAIVSADSSVLVQKIRLTLKLSFGIALLASGFLLVGADFILYLFKGSYVEHAGWSLRLLGLAVLPLVIRSHYVAIRRIYNRIGSTAALMTIGCVLELGLAAMGAKLGGLAGLSLGWLIANCIEAVVMLPTVYRVATSRITTQP